MCASKEVGDLGVRDLRCFNYALLRKWRRRRIHGIRYWSVYMGRGMGRLWVMTLKVWNTDIDTDTGHDTEWIIRHLSNTSNLIQTWASVSCWCRCRIMSDTGHRTRQETGVSMLPSSKGSCVWKLDEGVRGVKRGLFLGSLKRKVGNGGDTLFRFYLGNGYRCFSLLFSLHASGERACMHKLWFISGLAVLASCLAIQIVFKHWGDQVRESWH